MIGAYLGGASTRPSSITLATSDTERRVFEQVTFRSESFEPPVYYGYRVGYRLGRTGVFVEAELIHLKVIADQASLAAPVQHFAMSHGMNFILANVVWMPPAGDRERRLNVVARAGIGPTLPHVEARVSGEERQGYEAGGVGFQLAPGLAVRVGGPWRLTADYKFTFARPRVSVPGGTITTSLSTHHVTVGICAVL